MTKEKIQERVNYLEESLYYYDTDYCNEKRCELDFNCNKCPVYEEIEEVKKELIELKGICVK